MGKPVRWGRLGRWVAACAMAVLASGCTTVRNGGAPDPSFSLQSDLEALKEHFKAGASVQGYYAGQETDQRRNEFVAARLALSNLAYIQFISSLTADKQQLDAATDLFTLGLAVAGTLVTGSQVKTYLAAASALALGTKSTIDKHFYFEKTTPALIAAMNAKRKEVLVRILAGLQLPIAQYSFPQALSDTHDYYVAGTLNGAIANIQADAGAKEAVSDRDIRELKPVPVVVIDAREKVTSAVQAAARSNDLESIKKMMTLLGIPTADAKDVETAKALLLGRYRDILRNNIDLAAQIAAKLP